MRVILPMLRPAIVTATDLQLRARCHRGQRGDLPGTGCYNLATVYIVGRADVGEYGVAIVYSAVLVIFMTLVLLPSSSWSANAASGRRAEAPAVEAPSIATRP